MLRGVAVASERTLRSTGLRYVSDSEPGITRRGRGKGFSYHAPDGSLIREPGERKRIDSLAIPPAYREVWICPDERGHLQATARDERGRKQYIYHPEWLELRERDKFEHLLDFARKLPRIRDRVRRDLRLDGLPRRKVLAAVVRLLESSLVRVGNASYARENGSYGLTTIRKKHLELVDDNQVVLEFEGKGGQEWRVEADDPRIAAVLRQCAEIPGYELFKYIDDEGSRRDVESGHVNDYLREVTGEEITAKDFRTWAGTVLCARELAHGSPGDERSPKKNVVAAVKTVAQELGNTPAVCRRSYVHPQVIESYLEGSLQAYFDTAVDRRASAPRGLKGAEVAVWALLAARSGAKEAA